ncbi:MAG: HEAT repeat domain-containing protein [Planctomycetes bacterium]|nr:HEAT repeat domain-containing protein [Planctomycetota bacterium]
MRKLNRVLHLGLAAALLAGCTTGPHVAVSTDWRENLKSTDPDLRVYALRVLVERGEKDALPFLLDRLEDDEPQVRMFAFHAVCSLAGEPIRYTPYGSEAVRAAELAELRKRWPKPPTGGAGATEPKPAQAPAPEPAAPTPAPGPTETKQ